MYVKKASFGYIVWLLPEEEQDIAVMEHIEHLKETSIVAVLISGNECAAEILRKIVSKRLN